MAKKYKRWTDEEIAILEKWYPKGVAACLALLPDRDRLQIQRRASVMGVASAQGMKRAPRTLPLVAQLYAFMKSQGITREELASKSGVSVQTLCNMKRRAPKLHLFTAAANAAGLELKLVPRP